MSAIDRMMLSVEGLALGDALGDFYLYTPNPIAGKLRQRSLPPPPWIFTDDTEMALALIDVLRNVGCVDQDQLAEAFATRYLQRPGRGYGPGMCEILEEIADGRPWRKVSAAAYGGEGSQGNGGAMRVGPLGAFFAGDLEKCAEQARLSAEVTHAHLEGQAGAIAVAVAASWLADEKRSNHGLDARNLLQVAESYTPPSKTKDRIKSALEIKWELPASEAAKLLGNGSTGLTQDTVAYCLWCAARKLDSFGEAIWFTLDGEGDMDTTCAIVGGLVALAVGRSGLPEDWLSALEPLK